MKISKATLDVLDNFSSINNFMPFVAGKVIRIINEAKSVVGRSTLDVEIPQDFGIADLSRFIDALSSFKEPEIVFDRAFLNIVEDKAKIKYVYGDSAVITKKCPLPAKDVVLPGSYISFDLNKDILARLKKTANILGLQYLSFVGENGILRGEAFDAPKGIGDTSYIELGETNRSFRATIDLANLLILPDSYTVTISDKGVIQFVSVENPLTTEYWIAVELSSSKFS